MGVFHRSTFPMNRSSEIEFELQRERYSDWCAIVVLLPSNHCLVLVKLLSATGQVFVFNRQALVTGVTFTAPSQVTSEDVDCLGNDPDREEG